MLSNTVVVTVVDFEEFEYLFDIIDTINQIGQSTMLPLLIRLARVQSEIKFAYHMRHTTLQGGQQFHAYMDKLHNSEFNLRRDLESAEEQVVGESDSSFLSLRNWEYLGIVLNFIQMVMLILAFSPNSPCTLPRFLLIAFPLWYTFELMNRAMILGSKSTKGFMYHLFACPERPRFTLMHKIDASLTTVSLLCSVLCLFFSSRPLNLFANASVWRVFVIHPGFRNILFVCSQGVAPLRMFLGLVAIAYYYFCLIFYELCQGKSVAHNFDTLHDTAITMYQVLVGIHEALFMTTR